MKKAGALVLLLLATAWVYWPVQHYAFVNWDDTLITQNQHVVHGLNRHSAWWALTTTYAGEWIPVTWLSRLVDVSVFGLDPAAHHLVNLAIHLINVALLFAVLYRMTGSQWRSWSVAALFALHPLNVGTVAWIIERKGLLSMTGFLLTLAAYRSYVNRPDWRRILIVLLTAIAAVLAKPMAVSLPVALLLLDVWPLRRVTLPSSPSTWVPLLREKIPLAAIMAAAALVTFFAEHGAGVVAGGDVYPIGLRVCNALISYVREAAATVWPVRLAAYYPLPPHVYPPWWLTAAAAGTLLAVSALVVRYGARRPYLITGWAWYLATFVPAIGVIQISDAAHADRFCYVPAIGLFIVAAWGLPDLLSGVTFALPIARVVVAAALVTLAVDARVQLGYWKNSLTLWTRSLEVAPDSNVRAHGGIADALADDGRLDEAVEEYREALRLLPRSAEMHNNLGRVLLRRGDEERARSEFTLAVALDPDVPEFHNNLGALLAREERLTDATREYQTALRLQPDFALARFNLGLALARTGDLDGGIRECQQALRDQPRNAPWEAALARLLATAGRRDEAIRHLTAALAIDPDYEPAKAVLAALGKQ